MPVHRLLRRAQVTAGIKVRLWMGRPWQLEEVRKEANVVLFCLLTSFCFVPLPSAKTCAEDLLEAPALYMSGTL